MLTIDPGTYLTIIVECPRTLFHLTVYFFSSGWDLRDAARLDQLYYDSTMYGTTGTVVGP